MSYDNKKNMDKNIARARKFAHKSLKENLKGVSQGDYFIFQISKFLLLKESIIKKDCKNNIIYFNYEENGKYLKAIKQVVDYVRENGKLVSNDIEVIIEPEEYNHDDSLKSYIRDFHKIRDTFAHGAYDIDLEKGVIILDNDNLPLDGKINFTHYEIKGELPISMLELFSFVYKNPKPEYTEPEIQEYSREVREARSRFGYDNIKYDQAIKEYNKIHLINKNLYVDKYEDEKYNSDPYISQLLKINNTYNINLLKSYKNKNIESDQDILVLIEEKERELKSLINILLKSKEIPIDTKIKILRELQKYGLIDLSKLSDKITLNKRDKKDKIYVTKLVNVISEISSILGMKTTPERTLKVAAVYNYMQVLMAFKHEELKRYDGDKKKDLGKLKISKIHPKYKEKNPNYEAKIAAINKFVEKIIIPTFEDTLDDKGNVISKGLLSRYEAYPNSSFRESINKTLEKFMDKLSNDLADRNLEIITSIRNSLEHGNIEEVGGNIILKDRSNQNDDSTTNFECYGTPDDFYEMFKSIDLGIQTNDFTFDDFFIELKEILDNDLYFKLQKIFEKIKKINENALLSTLKQVIAKK